MHRGAKRLCHPHAESIKTYKTTYSSNLISNEKGSVDFNSLQQIESAIEYMVNLIKAPKMKERHGPILKDFQVIYANRVKSVVCELDK